MYVPPAFHESNPEKLWDLIERNSFGLLVSSLRDELFATHLPLLLERDVPPHGQLLGHLARANPQWQELAGREILAVFSGPHAYISPSWYESDNVVPTWNYAAVHVYGQCEIIQDEQATASILQQYVRTYEGTMERPWTIDSGTPYFVKMLQMVVAFRIHISRIEGKWKLNQNHPAERREKVARHLFQRPDDNSRAVAQLINETLLIDKAR